MLALPSDTDTHTRVPNAASCSVAAVSSAAMLTCAVMDFFISSRCGSAATNECN